MTQPPVRYENYPPDEGASADSPKDQRAPIVRPYLPAQLPPPPATSGTSRRTVIGLVIGIPVAGIILSAMAAGSNSGPDGEMGGGMGDGYPYDPGPSDQGFSVGSYTATAPDGWSVNDDGSGTVEVSNGANRLTALSLDTGTSTLAVDEIAPLAKRHYIGFSGKIGDPVDRSSASLQHATMDGAGTFNGKTARLMVELWIDEDGSGLLVTRVITAKVSSAIAVEAQEMLEELSGEF